jgi:hypothetical protein
MYTDDILPVFRFLHILAGRVRQVDGFAACVVDPSAINEGTRQLRVQGLDDQPGG